MDLTELENIIGYVFKDKSLLRTAVTHRSYVNELRIVRGDHNERLEFLGDAVLEVVSSDYLYRNFPELSEGKLSKLRASLVCEDALFEKASKIGLGKYVKLGVGAEKEGGRTKPSIVSDCTEAIIAAVYLDGGMEPAKAFIMKFILDDVKVDENITDAKSRLQEYYQKNGHSVVSYRIVSEEGPSNNRIFTAEVLLDGNVLENGTGNSKRGAEMQAALKVLKKLGI